MLGPEPLWNQLLDLLADQVLSLVAEELLRLCVDQDDVAVPVHDDDSVGRGLEEAAELVFGFSPLGDVADGARDQHAILGLEGAEADLDRKFTSVLAQAVK